MDIRKRLFRRPFSMLLWLLFVTLMTGFLTASSTLWYSTAQLAATLNKSHTAIAVRSDPGIVVHQGKRNAEWEVDFRQFTEKDVQTLSSMNGVKSVRSHTLSGGCSPAFLPIMEIRRESSWRANGDISPYYNAVFFGRLVKKSRGTIRAEYSGRTVMDGQDENDLFLLFELKEVLLLNSDFSEPLKNMKYAGGFSYAINLSENPDAEDYFTKGECYVVSGTFQPLASATAWGITVKKEGNERVTPRYFVIEGGCLSERDGYLVTVSKRDVPWSYGSKDEAAAGMEIPAVERWDGDPQTFFEETPHDSWRTFRDAWEMQSHTLPVIGTDRLETVFAFLQGDVAIIEGRSFTEEEYTTGARVMVISEIMANRTGLSVGDTIPMSQCFCTDDAETRLKNGYPLNNPVVDSFRTDRAYSEAETFEIVGVYRQQAEWSTGTYAFTPNTVFIPRNAQIAGGFGTIGRETQSESQSLDGQADMYGMYVSLELENGNVEEFQLALEQSPYSGQFYVYDQGYEAVQKDINGLTTSMARLLWIAVGGWILLLIMYLLMYQSSQKKNISIMRSLGTPPSKAAAYLSISGLLVAAIGIVIGTVLSRVALEAIQERILSEMLAMIDRTSSNVPVLSDEVLAEMVRNSVPLTRTTWLIALSEFGVMGAAILIHAAVMSHMPFRRLSEE